MFVFHPSVHRQSYPTILIHVLSTADIIACEYKNMTLINFFKENS